VPGYVVVMPDYPSLGVSTDPHPYIHLSIANSVEDMLKAAIPAYVNGYMWIDTHYKK
jgi:hypothetical protein